MSSSILPSCIVRVSPFSDDPNWYYILHSPAGHVDPRRLEASSPPTFSSLTVDLNFATQTISGLRNSDEQELPSTTETKRFMFDIREFNHPFSAEQLINSMFMNTSTGRALSIERRRWLVSGISDFIMSFAQDGVCAAFDQIFSTFDVVEIVQDEDLNRILQESFEDHAALGACPAPPALLESLVIEVFRGEEEAVNCMICLEEFVAGTEVKRLPCSHLFHGDCIDGWFAQRDSCPLCRFTLHA